MRSVRRAARYQVRSALWRVARPQMLRRSEAINSDALRAYETAGLIFIKVPKTAGRSVCQTLYGCQFWHKSWREVRDMSPDLYESLPTFAVFRDPIDRFLSAYDYLKQGGINRMDAHFGETHVAPHEVNAFVDRFRQQRSRRKLMRYFHFQPQSFYVASLSGRLKVSRLLRFESLAEEFTAFTGRDLPHINKTVGDRTTEIDLTARSKDFLSRLYQADYKIRDSYLR